MTTPLITSDMWQTNKLFAIQIAVGHHIDVLFKGIFALRDENGKRPEFSQQDILEGIWRFLEASNGMFAKYALMQAELACAAHANLKSKEEIEHYRQCAIADFMDTDDSKRVIMSYMSEYEKEGMYK